MTPAIFVDEIGIEIGILGDCRLKAAYQPVFARDGDCLHAVAADGSAMPFLFGETVDPAAMLEAVPPGERLIVTALGMALCLRNLHHAGIVGPKLIVGGDPGFIGSVWRGRAAARALAAEIARNGLAPGDVTVELAALATADDTIAAAAAGALQERGIQIAVVERGDGPASNLLPQPLPPDLVRIDGAWFRTIARQAATARLFRALVRAYRSRGAKVLVDGIETAAELRVALDSEADLLMGGLLAPAALAGAVFPDQPIAIESFLAERRVVPLFR